MTGEAVLTSLHIEGFRTFRKLDVAGLGHVNLLVGRNNTGKTMLLEAVRLERVVECLRIATAIEKVALVAKPWKEGRSVMVRMKGEREPVPLRSLGDGIGRVFWIALAMENARESGVLLLDEIENGIHWSVLPDLWRFIFHTARAHGIQVFAASHSWDCIEAFTNVAVDDMDSRGVLVQLTRRGDDILATVFGEDELRIVTRDGIEVR